MARKHKTQKVVTARDVALAACRAMVEAHAATQGRTPELEKAALLARFAVAMAA